MTDEEKHLLKQQYGQHAFLLIVHPLGSAVVAIPRSQATETKAEAVSLYHGATVRIGYGPQDQA